jgi:hypothetical protein
MIWSQRAPEADASMPDRTTEVEAKSLRVTAATAATAPQPRWDGSFLSSLEGRIRETKGARFNAYRRLRAVNEWSLRTLSLLSVYSIAVGLLLSLSGLALSEWERELITFALTATSVAILVLSLLEAGQNYQVRAERFHDCGRELLALQNDLELTREVHSGALPVEELQRLRLRYDELVMRYQENHTPEDYELFKAERRAVYDVGLVRACWIRSMYWTRTRGAYVALVVLPPLVFTLWLLRR